jgi:glycerol uptake facilitator-like aquaporin
MSTPTSFSQKLWAEAVGTALLLATVVGSGIMGENLSQGNDGIALLANTIATGAILYVLITMFGPVSGAHFNPAVTFCFWLRKELDTRSARGYLVAQFVGGIVGVIVAHWMFGEPTLVLGTKSRTGLSQWFAEAVATGGLLLTILGCLRSRPESIPTAVGLYITAGYWFTASTSFANPAVTFARSFTDSFAGIQPLHMPLFMVAQLLGMAAAMWIASRIWPEENTAVSEQWRVLWRAVSPSKAAGERTS